MFEKEFRILVKNALEIDNVDWGSNEEGMKFPTACIYMANESVDRTFDGPVSLRKSLVRVDIWSEDVTECLELKYKLVKLDGYMGIDAIKIHAIQLQNLKQSRHKGENCIAHQYSLDFFVWHY